MEDKITYRIREIVMLNGRKEFIPEYKTNIDNPNNYYRNIFWELNKNYDSTNSYKKALKAIEKFKKYFENKTIDKEIVHNIN